MYSDSDSVDSTEGQLLENKRAASDRRNFDFRHGECDKAKRPLRDSSLLSQFFWGTEDDEMESRPPRPDRKRRWKGYGKRRAAAAAFAAAAAGGGGPVVGRPNNNFAQPSGLCEESQWHDLPMELLVRILSIVDNRTVVTASGVCRGWRDSVGQGIHDLSFSWCGRSVNELVQSVAPKFPRLQNCRLKRCFHLDDSAILSVSSNWPGLRTLELSEGLQLTDTSLHGLANGCPMLEKLDLSGCVKISETGLVSLIKNCNNLRHLNLWECVDAGTDTTLQALSRHCKSLQSLNLGGCGLVTDKGIQALARGCLDLRVIDLCRCSLITDQSVVVLSDKCHNLAALGLSTCPNITDRAMYSLIKPKPAALLSQRARGKRSRFSSVDLPPPPPPMSDFQMVRHHHHHSSHKPCATSSCSSSGSTCSDASKLPIKREGLDTLLDENPNPNGLVCLNVSNCGALSAQAVQAVCNAFPDLHTCPERHSLITSGCLNLMAVNCVCAAEAMRDKFKRERRGAFA